MFLVGSFLVVHYEHSYGVDVVGPGPPAADHDDGGALADVALSSSLLNASYEASLHVVRPVSVAPRLQVEERVHPTMHVAL